MGRPSRSALMWIPAYAGTSLGREAPAGAAQSLAILPPFGACRRDVGAHHRGVEHLNQVRGAAGCSEGVEEGLEHARLAQAPEALPNGKRFQMEFQFPNASG